MRSLRQARWMHFDSAELRTLCRALSAYCDQHEDTCDEEALIAEEILTELDERDELEETFNG